MTISVRVNSVCTVCGKAIRQVVLPALSLDEALRRYRDPDPAPSPQWEHHGDPALDEDHTAVPPDDVEPW